MSRFRPSSRLLYTEDEPCCWTCNCRYDMAAWLHTFPTSFIQGHQILTEPGPQKEQQSLQSRLSASMRSSVDHFVWIFRKLTASGEQWGMLNLAELQYFDPGIPGLRTFKHSFCQGWRLLVLPPRSQQQHPSYSSAEEWLCGRRRAHW